jgi:hypothetical protein
VARFLPFSKTILIAPQQNAKLEPMTMHEHTGSPYVGALLCLLLTASSASGQVTIDTTARFAVIGDFGVGLNEQKGKVAALVRSWNPEFIITLGDNRYAAIDYDSAVGRHYCEFLSEAETSSNCSGNEALSNAFFPSLGNHDYTDGDGQDEYLAYFTLPGVGVNTSGTSGNERYYDFIKGPVHFFVIDSQGALASASDNTAQRTWLQAQLAASATPWQIVYFHHPPYSSGKHGGSPEMRWPFARWGADAVMSGHDHNYERLSVEGITYFVNGLGGRSTRDFNASVSGSLVRYNDDFGAMLVNANESSVTFEFFSVADEVVDSFTMGTVSAP